METISISLPSTLYCSLFEQFGESTTHTIINTLSNLVGSISVAVETDDQVYPRPGQGTKTGKVWEIADKFSSLEKRATRQKVVNACLQEGINMNTANTQYSHWSKAPLQGGGTLRAWQSPDASYHHLFLELDLSCKPDHYPGVVIISNNEHSNVKVAEVQNLEKELPHLLEAFTKPAKVFWDFEIEASKRGEIITALTESPKYVGQFVK